MKQLLAACPKCGRDKLYVSGYEAKFNIMKKREWLTCKSCGFSIEVEKFKDSLLSV